MEKTVWSNRVYVHALCMGCPLLAACSASSAWGRFDEKIGGKQIMKKNGYLERRKIRDEVMQDAIRQTYQQYMTDTLILTLNDPEVMGKDVFGYVRLKRVLDAWGKKYDQFFDALTKNPEADYARAKMDAAMKAIVGNNQDFIPFEQRYQWLPEIRYDGKR